MNSYPDSWYIASSPVLAEQPPASGDLTYDVCVVGGGYAGLSCGLHLAKSGKSVAVLEAERVGWGHPVGTGGTLVPGKEQIRIHSKNGMAKRQLKNCGDLG